MAISKCDIHAKSTSRDASPDLHVLNYVMDRQVTFHAGTTPCNPRMNRATYFIVGCLVAESLQSSNTYSPLPICWFIFPLIHRVHIRPIVSTGHLHCVSCFPIDVTVLPRRLELVPHATYATLQPGQSRLSIASEALTAGLPFHSNNTSLHNPLAVSNR